jgi:hypothetical protein
MEHEEGSLGGGELRSRAKVTHGHISQIDNGPADVLSHTRDGIDEELGDDNENRVDEPSAFACQPLYANGAQRSPGALTQSAFSLVPTPSLSTTFSGSSPPTSVTVTKLELLALPLTFFALESDGSPRLPWDATEGRSIELEDCEREKPDREGMRWDTEDELMEYEPKSEAMPSRMGCETEREVCWAR